VKSSGGFGEYGVGSGDGIALGLLIFWNIGTSNTHTNIMKSHFSFFWLLSALSIFSPLLTCPGNQITAVGSAVNLQLGASDPETSR